MAQPATIERSFVPSRHGQLHLAQCGPADAEAIILLHQTPRSWREYRDVLPILGERYRAIAMDTIGFGDSSRPVEPASIELWAHGVIELLDNLGLDRVHVVGHHTGGVVAIELGVRFPDRVRSLVLSSTPFTSPEFRAARAERPPIDEVEPNDDGHHLTELWQRRQGFYPPGRPDLLTAFVADALTVADDLEAGHTAVATYRMEDVIADVTQPTLLIRATHDPFAFPHGAELQEQLTGALSVAIVDIDGGMVPLPDQFPAEFAAALLAFIDGLEPQ